MKRKYILKPGRHQFAPGSPAVHTNADLSDEEVEWYLNRYPHIAALIETHEKQPGQEPGSEPTPAESVTKPLNQTKPIGEIASTIIGEIIPNRIGEII